MKVNFSFLILLLHLSVSGQVNDGDAYFNDTYEKEFITRNKIKEIHVNSSVNGGKPSYHLIQFDKNGLLLRKTVFDSKRKKVNEYHFSYNNHGHQVERKNIAYDLEKTYSTTFYKTYEEAQLISETSSDLPYVTRHFFNPNGTKAQSVTTLGTDSISSGKKILLFAYDTAGRLKQVTESFAAKSDDVPVNIGLAEYIYDTNGNVTMIKRAGKSTLHFSYNKKGLLSAKRISMTGEFSGIEILEKYNYEFWKK